MSAVLALQSALGACLAVLRSRNQAVLRRLCRGLGTAAHGLQTASAQQSCSVPASAGQWLWPTTLLSGGQARKPQQKGLTSKLDNS